MLTAKTRARYGLRVFGSLVATTLAAGVVAGLGAGGAYALESAFFRQLPPGGPGADWTALSVFGAGLGVALLVFAAGLFVALADAVSTGMRAAESTPEPVDTEGTDAAAGAEASAEVEPTPETAAPDDTAAPTEREPAGGEESLEEPDPPVSGGEDDRGEEPMETDPFAEAAESDSYDPTDPIDDPHEAQSNPFGEPEPEEAPTADEWTSKTPQGETPGEDDSAWREEIEAKLDDDEAE